MGPVVVEVNPDGVFSLKVNGRKVDFITDFMMTSGVDLRAKARVTVVTGVEGSEETLKLLKQIPWISIIETKLSETM